MHKRGVICIKDITAHWERINKMNAHFDKMAKMEEPKGLLNPVLDTIMMSGLNRTLLSAPADFIGRDLDTLRKICEPPDCIKDVNRMRNAIIGPTINALKIVTGPYAAIMSSTRAWEKLYRNEFVLQHSLYGLASKWHSSYDALSDQMKRLQSTVMFSYADCELGLAALNNDIALNMALDSLEGYFDKLANSDDFKDEIKLNLTECSMLVRSAKQNYVAEIKAYIGDHDLNRKQLCKDIYEGVGNKFIEEIARVAMDSSGVEMSKMIPIILMSVIIEVAKATKNNIVKKTK